MGPSIEGLARFAELYSQTFGEQLTPAENEHKARLILNLYIAVYGSMSGIIKSPLTEDSV